MITPINYIVHCNIMIIKTFFNIMFPENSYQPQRMFRVKVYSYLVCFATRIFSQTFRTEDYEWKKIFLCTK